MMNAHHSTGYESPTKTAALSVHPDAARTGLGRFAAGQTESENSSAGSEYWYKERKSTSNFRLPRRYKWDLRSSGILRSSYGWLPTLRDSLSVPSLKVRHSWNAVPLTMGRIGCPETSVTTNIRYVKSQKSGDLKENPFVLATVSFQFIQGILYF